MDIRLTLPSGERYRERVKAPVSSRTAAERWGEARARVVYIDGPPKPEREVPTLADFAPRFIAWAEGERQKPSTIHEKRGMLRLHLVPTLGDRRLDSIDGGDLAELKSRLRDRSTKRANNVLTTLGKLLRVAVELGEIEAVPVTIKLFRVAPKSARFFDFDEFERLVAAAKATDPRAYVASLLGGEAGLRAGEMLALEWPDIDLARGLVKVERGVWRGHVETPKGNRGRVVPLTARLLEALRGHRHLKGDRVLCQPDGKPLSLMQLRWIVGGSCRRANLREGLHVLRHTFCSHLAMRGAPARAIQELAGHANLSTTQRYMHLAPGSGAAAIRLLEEPAPKPQAVAKSWQRLRTVQGKSR